jgi:hypothetical protein
VQSAFAQDDFDELKDFQSTIERCDSLDQKLLSIYYEVSKEVIIMDKLDRKIDFLHKQHQISI